MSMIAEEVSVTEKTLELCAVIAADDRFRKLQADVAAFLEDDASRLMYQSVHERGGELQQKRQAGIELGKAEIREFESAREELMRNDVARRFLDAQNELEAMQRQIGKYVGMTLELGRVPTAEDLAASESGCCGGGCGCG